MTHIPFRTPISADGEYSFPPEEPGSPVVVEISGNFGGGLVTLGYESPDDQFIPYKISTGGDPVTTTVPESYEVTLPGSGKIALSLNGATGPNILVLLTEKP